MLKQPNQENQPLETLTSEELRQSILTELEARKQELVELSNEQLVEIAGGILPTRDQIGRALYNSTVTVMCCGVGGALGVAAGQTFSNDSTKGALLGGGIGARAGLEFAKLGHITSSEEHQAPQRDLEAGTAHGQHYGTFDSTGAGR